MIDYEILKFAWWVLVGVLFIGFAVTDGMDMGVGTLLPFLGKKDEERRVIINTVGPLPSLMAGLPAPPLDVQCRDGRATGTRCGPAPRPPPEQCRPCPKTDSRRREKRRPGSRVRSPDRW